MMGRSPPMQHIKFRGNQSTGSGEEDFWRIFTIYGHGGHLDHVTTIVSINFHFLVPESLHIKFGFDWPSGFWEKPVLIFKCKWPWAKIKKWPWPSILTHLHYLNRFQVTGCKSSEKSKVFIFFYRKALVTKFDLANKIGQGQPRVIIEQIMIGRSPLMLHTKFCGNRSTGSREEDFWRVFTIYGVWQPIWSCDQHHVNKFSFPWTWKLTYKIWLWLAQWFLRKASFKFNM